MKLDVLEQAVKVSKDVRPGNREELRVWVKRFLGMTLADAAVCRQHNVPLDYLEWVFFELGPTADVVVWAPRGGGKTMLGAVATLLDMLFKSGVQVRILGGSAEQSDKMYQYLRKMVEKRFMKMLKGKMTAKGFAFVNGSKVEILKQSETAVRGVRVQKLRCDEIELFRTSVWEAAQLTTRTMDDDELNHEDTEDTKTHEEGNETTNPKFEFQNPNEEGKDERQKAKDEREVRGAIEVFSTMHKVDGLMKTMVRDGEGRGEEEVRSGVVHGRKLFTWCIWDVMARCTDKYVCETCALLPGCQGRAKTANGFVRVQDVLAMKERVTQRQWESEVLCFRPYARDRVFEEFNPALHVRDGFVNRQPAVGESIMVEDRRLFVEKVVAGVDYGFNKFVCLWMAMMRDSRNNLVVWVMQEFVFHKRPLMDISESMRNRPVDGGAGDPWEPWRVYADVAGRQHDPHTGRTSEEVLRKAGFVVRSRGMQIEDGLGMINVLIDPAWNADVAKLDKVDEKGTKKLDLGQRLFINSGCVNLIKALENYAREKNGKPKKDGEHDHYVDALRYAVAGYNDPRDGVVVGRVY